jgi:hypothetical protein
MALGAVEHQQATFAARPGSLGDAIGGQGEVELGNQHACGA